MFKLKNGVKIEDLQELMPEMFFILGVVTRWFKNEGVDCVITSIKSDRGNIETVSDTHETFRGLDFRTSELDDNQIIRLENHVNKECQEYAAVLKSGAKRAAFYHANHLHVQCARKFLK